MRSKRVSWAMAFPLAQRSMSGRNPYLHIQNKLYGRVEQIPGIGIAYPAWIVVRESVTGISHTIEISSDLHKVRVRCAARLLMGK
jgi:hypothetical protein